MADLCHAQRGTEQRKNHNRNVNRTEGKKKDIEQFFT